MALNRPSNFIPSHQQEAVKAYFVYDAQQRLITTYEANFYANDGDPCLVTAYQYVGTSTRVQATKEYEGAWNGAWDF